MKLTLVTITPIYVLTAALPHQTEHTTLDIQGNEHIRWPVPHGMTLDEAQARCGDQAQLSCCNKATYTGDTTDVNSGLGSGLLSHLIGTGSGAAGAGIFDQCSKLDATIAAAVAIPVKDLLNQQCKQNIACCANLPSTGGDNLIGAAIPCVALGSIL